MNNENRVTQDVYYLTASKIQSPKTVAYALPDPVYAWDWLCYMCVTIDSITGIRPCVAVALKYGVINKLYGESDAFILMRHAIIVELKRINVGIFDAKKILLEWNNRCKKPLSKNEFKRNVLGYVDWVYKRECHLKCNKLKEFCQEACSFKKIPITELKYKMNDAIIFLEKEYIKYGRGYLAGITLMALLSSRAEKNVNVLFCSMREISERIYKSSGHFLEPMQISRSLKILEESGFIDIITGKNKKGARISNEYRFHQWDKNCCLNKAPHTQISSMGNS